MSCYIIHICMYNILWGKSIHLSACLRLQHVWPSWNFTLFSAEVPNKNFSVFHFWPWQGAGGWSSASHHWGLPSIPGQFLRDLWRKSAIETDFSPHNSVVCSCYLSTIWSIYFCKLATCYIVLASDGIVKKNCLSHAIAHFFSSVHLTWHTIFFLASFLLSYIKLSFYRPTPPPSYSQHDHFPCYELLSLHSACAYMYTQ